MTTGSIDAFYQNFVSVPDGAYGESYPPLLFLWRFFIVVSIAWTDVQWALGRRCRKNPEGTEQGARGRSPGRQPR